MTETIGYWHGVPIHELEKEGLLEVIKFLYEEMERYRKDRDAWKQAGDITKYLLNKVG